MVELRPFDRLGQFDGGWLLARYHFSFADYHDPDRMGVGALRVWNDDAIQPDSGFPPHGHRDMEIVTYVREGAITHEDSLGNVGRTEAGQVQVMSAGTGIRHSEYNREQCVTRIFQIWILPERTGLPPRWETRPFPRTHGILQPLASGHPEDQGVPRLFQDARVLGATLDKGDRITHRLDGRRAYLVPAKGAVSVNGQTVPERSGLVAEREAALAIEALDDAEIILVEVA
ncbi:MAG: pirin family protein [Magnetospirillum sp.]|nr:pirin family protein [Magnetospirillum sp.]